MERGIREEQKSVREILFDAEKKRKRFTVICRKAAERQVMGIQEQENRDYRDMEERLSAAREDYQKIPVPEEMLSRLEDGIARAEKEKELERTEEGQRTRDGSGEWKLERGGMEMKNRSWEDKRELRHHKRKMIGFRITAAVAAAAAVLVILPNTGAGAAHAMGALPVVGKLFQAVTFRDYQYESDRFDADVEVPQIRVDDMANEAADTDGMGSGSNAARGDAETTDSASDGQSGEKSSDQMQGTVEQINFDIEKVTNQLIEEFQESADLGESYGSLDIHHETVTDNDKYFTLKLSLYRGAGSGFQSYKFYTIDKKTGKQLQIGDLFREGSNYNETLSENIKEQMRARMAEDEMNMYWVDYDEVAEWNFERLKADQNFYFDGTGNLVIVFDEYEVAPGYMGAQEFTVEREVFEGLLK